MNVFTGKVTRWLVLMSAVVLADQYCSIVTNVSYKYTWLHDQVYTAIIYAVIITRLTVCLL